jgi:uncharacterized SAM-binding protein YcdF (DUF218 family)
LIAFTRTWGNRVFFYASKILLPLAQPSSLAVLLVVGGTVLAAGRWWPVLGRRALITGIALLLVLGLSPLGNIVVLPLEERFPRGELPDDVAGILVLGGFEDARVSAGRGGLAVNESAERLTEALLLARRLPKARLIFSGGVVSFLPTDYGTAEPISRFLADAGISSERVVLESRSRNTYENAVFSRELLQPRPGQRYVLVTAAFHMPRAVATFRAQGFDVIPWTVDYRTRDAGDALRFFDSIHGGLERVDLAFKEWVGLAAYYLTGRSGAIWPAP